MKRFLVVLTTLACLLAPVTRAADKLRVVATIPDLADMARQVGGDLVEVTSSWTITQLKRHQMDSDALGKRGREVCGRGPLRWMSQAESPWARNFPLGRLRFVRPTTDASTRSSTSKRVHFGQRYRPGNRVKLKEHGEAMNIDEVFRELKESGGIFEAYHVATFRGSRKKPNGSTEEVEIEILDRGAAQRDRYACSVMSESGKTATGNDAPTVEVAIAKVHWQDLDR
jgi:hypothetical protein